MKNSLTYTNFFILFCLAVIFIIAFPDCSGSKNTIIGIYPDESFDSSKGLTYTLQWNDSNDENCIQDGLTLKQIDSIRHTLK